MYKTFLLGLSWSLSAVSLASAVAPPADNLRPKQAIVVANDLTSYTGTLKVLPGGKVVLETLSKTYTLDFASRTASREAQKLAGMEVRLRAAEQKGGLMVHSVSQAPVHFCAKR